MGEWISVEERQPSKDGIYRVKVEKCLERTCAETMTVYRNGKWSSWGLWTITHWFDSSAEKGE